MPMALIQKSYSARSRAIKALRQAFDPGARGVYAEIRAAAAEMEKASATVAPATVSRSYSAYSDALGLVAHLVAWRDGVLEAEPDSQRHAAAAKARADLWVTEYGADPAAANTLEVVEALRGVSELAEVAAIAERFARCTLPVAVREAQPRPVSNLPGGDLREKRTKPLELEVAFLKFRIDGEEAQATHFLQPSVAHDLEVEVRISRWPEGATALVLRPVSTETADLYDLPTFKVARGGEPPFTYTEHGRAVLKFAHSLASRPYEFKYSARFAPESVEQPVSVVGHRTLRLEGIDIARTPITGYRGVDQKLLHIRDKLRRQVGVPPHELSHALMLLSALGGIAARGLQDDLFRPLTAEASFQQWLKGELRRYASIGGQLEEHPKVGTGIADLSFHRARLELKYEGRQRLVLNDCRRFVGQAQAYAAFSNARISFLCVLDNSPKQDAPFPAEDGIDVFRVDQGPSLVIVVLMQGGCIRPSDLSRKAGHAAGGWL